MRILTTGGIALYRHMLLIESVPEAPTSIQVEINTQMLTRKAAEKRVPCSDSKIVKAE
jgi:hypothetical protein